LSPSVHQDPRLNQIVELYSPHPKAFNYQSLVKLKVILPLIEAGLNKKREELESSIANIVQDQFTSIDPSVYWKFRESAIRQLKQIEKVNGHSAEIKPIIFKEVYPLYGQADIVGSSVHRNKAIQADLQENLRLLKKTLQQISPQAQAHLLDYYFTKVDQLLQKTQKSFRPSDETHIMDLLKNDIHPCLQNLQEEYPELKEGPIGQYFKKLNQHLGIVYRARKDFEDSVSMINHHLSEKLQEADQEMQEKLPHYFEKYQTDGIEYNMYIGQSILPHQQFSEYYLKNFRLWQLLTMCEMTQKVEALQPSLPTPLTTAQLIFVYSDPLDIRFRMDEKHFDVDGAYNVRYEIIKKRIDKAVIQGSKERLTQPGKIAIVYLHEKNRIEYLDYLQYLQEKNLISQDIEELELGKLQGVEGLRALRVSVK
jgi:prefoldin subunit 5